MAMVCGGRNGTEGPAWNLALSIGFVLRRGMDLVHFFLWRSLSAGPEIAARNRTGANLHSSRPGPISNRELELLERHLSCCKQRKATVSNRELPTIRNSINIVNPSSSPMSEAPFQPNICDPSLRPITLTKEAPPSFLPG